MFCLRNTVQTITVLIAMTTMAAPALAGPEGRYTVSGINPGGLSTYRGTVNVAAIGEAYEVTWIIGDTLYSGIAVYANGILSIAYYGSNMTGVAVYREQSDGSWAGNWVVVGSGRLGRETWEPR